MRQYARPHDLHVLGKVRCIDPRTHLLFVWQLLARLFRVSLVFPHFFFVLLAGWRENALSIDGDRDSYPLCAGETPEVRAFQSLRVRLIP